MFPHDTTVEELLQVVISVQYMLRLYNKDQQGKYVSCSHELFVRW
jgi:hypothetical protein